MREIDILFPEIDFAPKPKSILRTHRNIFNADIYYMKSNPIIQIDFGKPIFKILVLGLVLVATIFSSFLPGSQSFEVNRLPPNRSEISSIISLNISVLDSSLKVEIDVNCIYMITVSQHLKFFHLDIDYHGITFIHNYTNCKILKATKKKIILLYYPSISGNVKVSFYRAKTLLTSAYVNLTGIKSDPIYSSISCQGDHGRNKICSFSPSMISLYSFFIFSSLSIKFDQHIFVSPWNSNLKIQSYQGNYSSKCTNFMDTVSIENMTYPYPQNWAWIKQAAHIFYLKRVHKIKNIIIPHSFIITNATQTFLSHIGNFTFIPTNMTICLNKTIIDTNFPEKEDFQAFKESFNNINPKFDPNKLIIMLPANPTDIQIRVTNINQFAHKVCPECHKHAIFSNISYFDMISEVKSSHYVIIPHSFLVSQGLWIDQQRGTLIEILPKVAETQLSWTENLANIFSLSYKRIFVTSKSEENNFHPPKNILNETFTIDLNTTN